MTPVDRAGVALVTLVMAGCGDGQGPGFDLSDCSVPMDQFFDGGVVRGGIPALTTPDVAPGGGVDVPDGNDRVLGVVLDGEARAYPFSVLWWHEVVNDTLAGRPILVSYCPLTGSGIVFDPQVNGTARAFGVSGLLRENNLVMFDRETESLWNQMTLGAQCGVERGQALDLIPVVEATWDSWRSLYPNTTVVTRNTGIDRPYDFYPYGDYAIPNNPFTTFPSSPYSDLRPPKELVLGVFDGPASAAFAFGVLTGVGRGVALNEVVGTRPVVVTFVVGYQTAQVFDRRVDGTVLTLAVTDTAAMHMTDAETGTTWDATGRAIAGPLAGQSLSRVESAYVAFWFAWSVFHPETRLFLPG